MGDIGLEKVHFNDWPNTQGFDTAYEEREPIELSIIGHIPQYAAGTFFRTGLGRKSIATEKGTTWQNNHWFDNLSLIHRFQIVPSDASNPKIMYNSRSTCDGLIENIRKTGKRDTVTFAAKYDPCKSFFKKFQSVFTQFLPSREPTPDTHSSSVTISVNLPGISPNGRPSKDIYEKGKITTLVNKTDSSKFQLLDPVTLEPIGLAQQKSLHPALKGPFSAAHAKSDPVTGDVFNYNLQPGYPKGTYRVFTVSAATAETSILATFPGDPAYLHSLFLTKHYVILCVWNSSIISGGLPIMWNQNVIDALNYDPSRPAMWYVIDRVPAEKGGKGLVATYESDPFFCFHTINAYEEQPSSREGHVDIVADMSIYDNLDVLKKFYLENLVSDGENVDEWGSKKSVTAYFRRFKLEKVPVSPSSDVFTVKEVFSADRDISPELPTINPATVTQKHRYIYGVTGTGKSSFLDGLVKFDVETRTAKTWSEHGQTAAEPIFVADPASTDEDGGVLLTVVLDGYEGKSFLLVLDAKTMTEIGRAHVDGAIGFGFHGTFVPSGGTGLNF
ncbi:MAG: hypothetical protein Q9227_003903 [Pyrenula ochraceoflavens]